MTFCQQLATPNEALLMQRNHVNCFKKIMKGHKMNRLYTKNKELSKKKQYACYN